jgi:hypothetical protein
MVAQVVVLHTIKQQLQEVLVPLTKVTMAVLALPAQKAQVAVAVVLAQ